MNDNYFRREKILYGKHAEYTKKLKDEEIFVRNVDVYKVAPLIGFLYNKKVEEDKVKNSSSKLEETKIFTDQIVKESKYLKINFQLIILLDKEYEKDEEKRMEKAFRNLADNQGDIELFESYVRGGIEILYKKCISDSTQKDDFMYNIKEFIEEIKETYTEEYSF